MSDLVSSMKLWQYKTRRVALGLLAVVLAGLAPCAAAAPAARPLAAKPAPGNQVHLMYRHDEGANISGEALGQEVLSSAVSGNSAICVDPHNASVLLINLNVAAPIMVDAAPPQWVSPSIADATDTKYGTVLAGTLGNALADVNAIGIVATKLSR